MRHNDTTNWSHSLLFVQWGLNFNVHEGTKVVPCKALFVIKPKIGLKTVVPSEQLVTIKTSIEKEILIDLLKDNKHIAKAENSNGMYN